MIIASCLYSMARQTGRYYVTIIRTHNSYNWITRGHQVLTNEAIGKMVDNIANKRQRKNKDKKLVTLNNL